MALAVIAYFDPETEARVRALQELLPVPSTPPVVAVAQVRPHISLAYLNGPAPESLCGKLREFANGTPRLAVRLAAVGAFPTKEGVVFIAPISTRALFDLRDQLCVRLAKLGLTSDDNYGGEKWVAHCTVAINLSPEQVQAAVGACVASEVFQAAELAAIGLVEYPPAREICAYELAAPPP